MTQSMRQPHQFRRHVLLAGLALPALLSATCAMAEPPAPIQIPAGSLENALLAVSAQTHQQVLFPRDLVAGKTTPALTGTYSAEEAIRRLAPADITITRAGPSVLVLRKAPTPHTAVRPEVTADRPFAPDGLAPDPAKSAAPVADLATTDPASQSSPATVSEVQVTGSHIRGGNSIGSPLLTVTSGDIEKSGQATLAEALNVLPQNFGGDDTEQSVTTRASRAAVNLTFASGINLRGLGNDATLVLVNGRRLGGSGNKGDFTDLSMIPTIAVSRVEVLLDGASAIYGSDAVGGVVNVILRQDLEGGEIHLRGGTSTSGGASEAQLGVVLGHTWSTGSVVLALEGGLRGDLPADQRSYTRTADLRPFGGSDFRLTTSFPGNVIAVNPATGVSGPFFGIPPGQNGLGLTPASFRAGALNFTDPQAGIDILPDQTRQSAYLAFHQALGDRLEISGDARYGVRIATAAIGASLSNLTVTKANPFFVSPNGASSNSIVYDFIGELPAPMARDSAKTFTATLGGKLKLPGDWVAQAYGAHAEETDESRTFGLINTAILAEALGNVPDNAATPFSAARDGFFNPYTGVASNPAAVTQAIGSGFSVIHGKSQVTTGNLQLDGTVLSLPGGALKVAVGADMRREVFERQGTNFLSTALPTPQAGVSGHRTVEAGFVEARIPVVGPDNVLPGVKALDLSLAARYEHYSDFGHTLNPKVGLTWAPADDLKVRASYGTSFRAPGLTDLKSAAIFQALQFPVGSARVLALALTGGNPNLRPETATSWTAGFDYAPAAVPGLKLSATWFDTNFKGRVDRPVAQNITGALTDPRFVDFVTHINPATSATDLALINSFLANPAAASAQGLFPATAYQAIVDIRQVNTGILDVEGLDLQGGYRHDAFGGRFDIGANASHLFHYDQSLTPTAASQQLAGTATFPAKWRARGTIDWTRDRFSLGGAVNFLSSFHDTLGVPIKSQTTLDLQARFAAPPGPFEHTRLTLSVRNVFDTAPPFYNNPFGFAYDATNAEVIGRFVALQISRSW